jgi:hypothetical protein
VSTTQAELVAKFAARVIGTGGNFAAGVVDTGGFFHESPSPKPLKIITLGSF